jgi:hypothetical protein
MDYKENEEYNYGTIPILIELCKSFKFTKIKYDKKIYNKFNNPDINEKINYFKNHIISCNDCNVINNNNKDLSYYITTSIISFEKHLIIRDDIEEGINKYMCAEKYDIFNTELEENNMKIIYIKDKQSIYYKCLLIFISLKN